MSLTNDQKDELYHFFVERNLFYTIYDPKVFVTKYLQLPLANDDEAFQYVFSYLDSRQLSETYDWIIQKNKMENEVLYRRQNIEKLFHGVFEQFKVRRGKAGDEALFEQWLSIFEHHSHPAAVNFKQVNQERKMKLAAEEARKKELELAREQAAQKAEALVIQQYTEQLKLITTASQLNDYLTQHQYAHNAQKLIITLPEFQQKIRQLIKSPMDFRLLFSKLKPDVIQQVFHLFDYSFLMSLARKQNERDKPFLYCIDATKWLEEMKHLEHSAPPQNLLQPSNFYAYTNSNRFHLFTVEYEGKKGDQAKTAILNKLSQEISACQSKESLAAFKQKTMSEQSVEYTILKTGTGFFTRVFGLKTDSVIALEKMFIQAESGYSKA